MSNISFLIDTNIFIPLEPTEAGYVNTNIASDFHRLVQETGNTILLHPIIDSDFDNDKDETRRALRKSLKKKYPVLSNAPTEADLPEEIRNKGKSGTHTWIDNHFLATVYKNCVHYLVTEDQGIHKNARLLGIQDKVLYLGSAVEFLKEREGEIPHFSTHVEAIHPREINIETHFFDSLREDYAEFTDWFNNKVKPDPSRSAFLIRTKESDEIAAIAILKEEDSVEFGPKGKTLKICTFKVMPQFGEQRIGELLLKSILQYTKNKQFEYTYLTAYPKQAALVSFLNNFGFNETEAKKDNGELVLYKKLIASHKEYAELSSWEFNLRFGPFAYNFNGANSYVVPIKPNYHDILFPELTTQTKLFSDDACGNSIRKSYICHAPIKKIKTGDMLFFYRSEHSDFQAIAIVEKILRSNNAEDVIAFVGNRTLYKKEQIQEWCEKEALVINFRVVSLLKESVVAKKYFATIPQSICGIDLDAANAIISTFKDKENSSVKK